MDRLDVHAELPDLRAVARGEDLLPLQMAAIAALVDTFERGLTAAPIPAPTPLEDLSLRHLAKAAGTTASALRLMRAQCWTDACILTRAVFEQLFTYLWVVQDADRAEARGTMVTIKQEWANAKYLEGLAAKAPAEAQAPLLEGARQYREVAEGLLARLASELGTTEKKVRDEATMRASLKAIEVNLGPEFSIPYAYYSGFVHSDGVALAAYGTKTPEGVAYSLQGERPDLPLASDMHRVLLRLAEEVRSRCPRLALNEASLASHAAWLAAIDART
jgi:hypothetical protein